MRPGDISVGTGTVPVCVVVGILFKSSSNKTPNILSCFCWSMS